MLFLALALQCRDLLFQSFEQRARAREHRLLHFKLLAGDEVKAGETRCQRGAQVLLHILAEAGQDLAHGVGDLVEKAGGVGCLHVAIVKRGGENRTPVSSSLGMPSPITDNTTDDFARRSSMNKRVVTLAIGALIAPLAPAGAAELRYNAGVVSDYVYRGVSRTDDHAAVQGGVDIVHESGLYAGAWASNVDFADADLELDARAGVALKSRSGWGWDLGVIAYRFDESRFNYEEWYVGVTYGYLGAKVWRDWHNDDTYTEANASYEMGSGFYAILHGGFYVRDRQEDYSDYALALGRKFSDFDARVTLSNTDLNESDRDDGNVVISLRTRW